MARSTSGHRRVRRSNSWSQPCWRTHRPNAHEVEARPAARLAHGLGGGERLRPPIVCAAGRRKPQAL
eukprot:7154634-Pyramimonas_sp.AAC.1